MNLDSGTAYIYEGRNTAEKGDKPKITYDQLFFKSYYGARTVGIERYYRAKAYGNQADLLIRISRKGISTAMRCQLFPSLDLELAGFYKILQVQQVVDEDGRPATDLTLERIENIDQP